MRILSRSDVEAVLTMADAIDAVETAFRQLAAGRVAMPQRAATPIDAHNGLHLSMPAFVAGDAGEPGSLSIKIVSVYPDNPSRHGLNTIQGLLLLHAAETGQPLALMDAEHLTAMRTGAVSGVATRYLARADAASVTLFGAGAQAGPQIEAVCAVRPIQHITVITRSGDKDAAFCARMSARLGVDVQATRDVRAAVARSDILCTATNAKTPLFDGAWLRPGAHINAVGAYTHTMRELDNSTLQRARVFVDQHRAAQTEAGDITLAIADKAITYSHVVGELGDVVTGAIGGRTSPDDITLFKSVGLAMQDTVTAARIYAAAIAKDIGQVIDL